MRNGKGKGIVAMGGSRKGREVVGGKMWDGCLRCVDVLGLLSGPGRRGVVLGWVGGCDCCYVVPIQGSTLIGGELL